MVDLAIAGLVALFVWWLATGVVMFAAWQSDRWQRRLMVAFTLGALAGCAGLHASSGMQSVTGTYLGFGSALAVWAWLEATFLFGMITGPRHSRCPGGARGLQRFRLAFLAVRDHELALLAGGALVTLLVAGGDNHAGLWTYLLLWGMRLSAKLNIFMGAPRAASVLIPKRLRYLTSYFRTDRISWLLPVTIIVSIYPLWVLMSLALGEADAHRAVAFMLLTTFMALAVLEHIFLVLPVSDEQLWLWAARDRAASDPSFDTVDRSGDDDGRSPTHMTPARTAPGETRAKNTTHKRGTSSWT